MKVIRTMDELDERLTAAAGATSDSELRDVFSSFRMDISSSVPRDPFSPEYLETQMSFYRRLAQKEYVPANEVSVIDVESGARVPFPFTTGVASLAGEHVISLGFLLSKIDVPHGGRIIEFGAGWGNTSIALAQLGYRVTVVDIERRFCDVIAARAEKLGLDIEVLHTDFFSAESIVEPYDAALFYECFHHCSDHMRLLRALRSAVKPEGKVYLGSEPILDNFPIPWGIRTDGESLWAARSNGWLELGFRTDYFVKALSATGWRGIKHSLPGYDWISVWVVERADSEMSFDASDLRMHSVVGTREGSTFRLTTAKAGYAMYGPYISMPSGDWVARLHLDASAERSGKIVFDICMDFGAAVLGSVSVNLASVRDGRIEVKFRVKGTANAVEARVLCDEGTTVIIQRVELARL